MKQLDRDAQAQLQRLPPELRAHAAAFFPTPEREAEIRREEAERKRLDDLERERNLAALVVRGQDGAFGVEVRDALTHAMRQCDARPTLEQLQRMAAIIREGQKKAAALAPKHGRGVR